MGVSSSADAAAAADDDDEERNPNNESCICSAVTCDRNSGVSVSSLADVTCARLERTYWECEV
jgi:hypothetical protein